ncbi:phosphate-starvation-inducible protein PsiE [Bacillus songklensis]|uniref:Protein PsiE n=1 Tax=Bacillus songklensis TaxID=1069116 RepID=A0ABV8B7W1_9BACI
MKELQKIIKFFQIVLNSSLVLLGIMLTFFMLRELYFIFQYVIDDSPNVHDILQDVLIFFLYFAFISIIVKYFKENYHFPIRYLLYIGITGTIRFIIVNSDHPERNLILSLVILILMISYTLNIRSSRDENN